MCLAIPSRVIAVEAGMADVECFGVQRRVSLLLMEDDLAIGDYVLVQAGGYAYERVAEDRALEALALMAEVCAQAGAPA